MPGPPPESDSVRQRTNPPTFDRVQVKWDGKTRGPDLPLNLPGIKWSTRTIAWYEGWRNSPQAMVFLESDWEFLLDTALLKNMLWMPRREDVTGKDGKIRKKAVLISDSSAKSLAAEIRQREDALGATFGSRQAKGMKIRTDNDEVLAEAQFEQEAEEAFEYVDELTKYAAKQREAKG